MSEEPDKPDWRPNEPRARWSAAPGGSGHSTVMMRTYLRRMEPKGEFNLWRLREIGCANWDAMPVKIDATTTSGDYDDYLVEAFTRLRAGAEDEDVADYLVTIETETIGMDTGSGMRDRALELTRAIRDYADESA